MASQEVLTALEALHKELEKLEPAIRHVETAQQVTETVRSIPQKHLELLKEIKDNDTLLKKELTRVFTTEVTGLANENKRLQNATSEIQDRLRAELEALGTLQNSIASYYDRIEKINFPERLDKMDANVAGIMAAVQAVQSRMDSIERNITDRLKDIVDYQKETRSTHSSLIKALMGRQLIFFIITWGILIAGAILLLLK